MYKTIIIGGGPAGLMCGIHAAGKTLLIEKNSSLGKKLALTGNGRCNITNNSSPEEFYDNIHNHKFLYSALSKFSNYEIITFFANNNLTLKVEDHGRMFPDTNNANSIIEILTNNLNCEVKLNEEVLNIQKNPRGFQITTKKQAYLCEKLVIATGSKAYPQTGSNGFGYKVAQQFGHTLTPLHAAEASLYSDDIICKSLQGVTLKNCALKINKHTYAGYNLLFTHFGISGPLAMRSAFIINSQSIKALKLDLLYTLSIQELTEILKSKITLKESLKPYLPKAVIDFLLRKLQLQSSTISKHLSQKKINAIVELIKSYPLTITKTAPLEKAFVTGGGVELTEINPKTFESKQQANLFLIGELLNVHAHTGGYNLTICLSMGYNCGINL